MSYEQYVTYAIYAVEQVLHYYESKYPNDPRPRRVLDQAKGIARAAWAAEAAGAAMQRKILREGLRLLTSDVVGG